MNKTSAWFPAETQKDASHVGFNATNTHRPLLVICKPFIIKEDAVSQRDNLIVARQEYQHRAWEVKYMNRINTCFNMLREQKVKVKHYELRITPILWPIFLFIHYFHDI